MLKIQQDFHFLVATKMYCQHTLIDLFVNTFVLCQHTRMCRADDPRLEPGRDRLLLIAEHSTADARESLFLTSRLVGCNLDAAVVLMDEDVAAFRDAARPLYVPS
mmetsp:Transcript_5691/g.10602  ORF Transcript_5691/g.10602 Transcript_5691/m.10602 type:complete len:105 (-) Transcript_5691:539-853(-)